MWGGSKKKKGGVAINNGSDEMSFAQTITQEITRELELYKKGIY